MPISRSTTINVRLIYSLLPPLIFVDNFYPFKNIKMISVRKIHKKKKDDRVNGTNRIISFN